MIRVLRKGLLWALAAAAVTTLLFDGLSYGFAHGNALLVVAFLGVGVALAWGLPGLPSLAAVFVYQLVYCVIVSLIVVSALAAMRVRKARLEAPREKPRVF